MSETRLNLEKYYSLEDNWDGNGAAKPPPRIVENAIDFIGLMKTDYPTDSMICPDGSLVLFWDDAREVEFNKNGSVYFRPSGFYRM